MSQLRRAYHLFRTEGASAVACGVKRRLLGYFDPLYQVLKPAYKPYSINSASAEFDMSRRKLGQYDFVDDLRSETYLIQRILSVVGPDDVFYDIGANIGIYSCLVGNQLDSGKIVAFEPTSDAFDVLEQNIERNGVDAELFNIACSDENGTTQMLIKGQTGHQFAEKDRGYKVETRRIDDLVEEAAIDPPDICKVDIEAAEYLALDGFRNTLLESNCRHVFCEIHTEKIEAIGGSAEEIESLFKKLGFEIEYVGDRRENYFVEATRTELTE
jgi:FkbM family methyltransferase